MRLEESKNNVWLHFIMESNIFSIISLVLQNIFRVFRNSIPVF